MKDNVKRHGLWGPGVPCSEERDFAASVVYGQLQFAQLGMNEASAASHCLRAANGLLKNGKTQELGNKWKKIYWHLSSRRFLKMSRILDRRPCWRQSPRLLICHQGQLPLRIGRSNTNTLLGLVVRTPNWSPWRSGVLWVRWLDCSGNCQVTSLHVGAPYWDARIHRILCKLLDEIYPRQKVSMPTDEEDFSGHDWWVTVHWRKTTLFGAVFPPRLQLGLPWFFLPNPLWTYGCFLK